MPRLARAQAPDTSWREVEHLGDLMLRLSFDDGLLRDVDLDPDVLHEGYEPATGGGPAKLRTRVRFPSPARRAVARGSTGVDAD